MITTEISRKSPEKYEVAKTNKKEYGEDNSGENIKRHLKRPKNHQMTYG